MSLLVVGAGIMGRGIALVAATEAERNVVLVDASANALADATAYFVERAEKEGLDQAILLSRITTKPSIEAAFEHAAIDFVIEAVPEKVALKKVVFETAARLAPPDTVFATNTSSIPITSIAEALTARDRTRVIGMHFFNPVPIMQALEVIPTKYTDESVVKRTVALAESLGKKVTVCKQDIAGFIVNRILNAQILEASSLVERGAGTPEEIDRVMMGAAGLPIGPFRVSDLVGLDTILLLMNVIYENSGKDPRYKPSPTFAKLVSEGKLGRKTGEGFYKYRLRGTAKGKL